ncbi:MAG: magnesium transporter [Alphaproteobacteria bacterium]|jgi:magnesium transporter|nr:magnesium transporter [Alphaproteobacteria bacterium]
MDKVIDRQLSPLPEDPAEALAFLKGQALHALEEGNHEALISLATDYHAADVADLLEALTSDDRRAFLDIVKFDLPAEVVSELDESVREEVFEILGPAGVAAVMAELHTDDALDLLVDLDEDQQRDILSSVSAGDRALLEEGLSYPEDSAGRLMQQEIVCVPPFWTVAEAIDFVREMEAVSDNLYDIYVVDPSHQPIGGISVGSLLKNPLDVKVSDVMRTDIHPLQVTEDQERVAHLFRRYALVSAPVVDENGRIVGMITFDDVITVIDEEAEEDLLLMANVGESDFHAPVLTTAYLRTRWLLVTLFDVLVSAVVIAYFEPSIQAITALAFLMPIGANLSGSFGMQVTTVMVRALATNAVRETDTWRAVGKEVRVALIVGGGFAICCGGLASLWLMDSALGMVLAASLFLDMIWAAFAGALVPIVIDRFKLDPAISSGPIITTSTDIFGFAIFLGLATAFLL